MRLLYIATYNHPALDDLREGNLQVIDTSITLGKQYLTEFQPLTLIDDLSIVYTGDNAESEVAVRSSGYKQGQFTIAYMTDDHAPFWEEFFESTRKGEYFVVNPILEDDDTVKIRGHYGVYSRCQRNSGESNFEHYKTCAGFKAQVSFRVLNET